LTRGLFQVEGVRFRDSEPMRIPFGDHPLKLERYRELAWPLRKEDTHKSRGVNIFCFMT